MKASPPPFCLLVFHIMAAQPVSTTLPVTKPRHEWYQTAEEVIITVFSKNLKKEDMSLTIKTAQNTEFQLEYDLFAPIDPSKCTVEVHLKKAEKVQWKSLEYVESKSESKPSYPSSSKTKHDWDKLNAESKEEEPDGDALNKLLQSIYSKGDDETRKAMMKSFTESGGTVLSTNWKDVGTKKVNVQAPDGMEVRKWDQ